MKKLLYLFLLLPVFLSAFDSIDSDIHRHIMNLQSAESPRILGQHIIFSFESDRFVRTVAAAFEHEDYTKIHTFQKNIHNVFFLVFRMPVGMEQLTYRIRVDGLWMTDPTHKELVRKQGIPLSTVRIPLQEEKLLNSIAEINRHTVEIRYNGRSGQRIQILGSFNNWDPFMHPMQEIEPGYYSARINVIPGRHYYYFMVQGQKILDPQNPHTANDMFHNQINYFDFRP